MWSPQTQRLWFGSASLDRITWSASEEPLDPFIMRARSPRVQPLAAALPFRGIGQRRSPSD